MFLSGYRVSIQYACALLLVMAIPSHAGPPAISPEALFVRCHLQFTQKRPAFDSPLLAAVRSGIKTPVAACMEILDSARIPAGNLELSPAKRNDPTAKAVLRSFNDFHNQFFFRNDATLVDDAALSSHNLRTYEFGHYLTQSLMVDGTPLRESITAPEPMEPLRSGAPNDFLTHLGRGAFRIGPRGNPAPGAPALPAFTADVFDPAQGKVVSTSWEPRLIPHGELVGFQPAPEQKMPGLRQSFNFSLRPQAGYDLSTGFGGGLLGDPGFLLVNTGASFGFPPDGGLKLYRRFSEAVLESLLCRKLPVLRIQDVAAKVDSGSQLPFRRGVTCLQCHDTMDPMAGVVRSFAVARSTLLGESDTTLVTMHGIDLNKIASPSDWAPPSPYQAEGNSGELRFRNIEGDLVEIPLSGAADLGSALAAQPDFYACMAKRYYEFLTGFSVPLYDPGDWSAPRLNSEELKHLEKVKSLGRNLQQHQSLRNLIEEILASSSYQRKQQ
jgi:hypothetical protein